MILDNTVKILAQSASTQNDEGTIIPSAGFVELKTVKCNLQNATEITVGSDKQYGIIESDTNMVLFIKRDAAIKTQMQAEIDGIKYEIKAEVTSTKRSRHQEFIITEIAT